MSILTGKEIQAQQKLGNIKIDPWDPSLLGPNSYDLHLGDSLLMYSSSVADRKRVVDPNSSIQNPVRAIDSRNPPSTMPVRQLAEGGWLLIPGTLYIGVTREWTLTRGFVPRIDGRSSLGRLGVFCHVTAGQGDNGFEGTWTLELAAIEPTILYPGDRLFQILYETVEGEQTFYGSTDNTSGRYQGQKDPTPTRIHKD